MNKQTLFSSCPLAMKNLKNEGYIFSEADEIFVDLKDLMSWKSKGNCLYSTRSLPIRKNRLKAWIESKDGSPSILSKLMQKLKRSIGVWSMRAPGYAFLRIRALSFTFSSKCQGTQGKWTKKRFSIQTDLLSWVHPEHATQSHGFRFGAGVCLAGQLCISQCRHTVSQERE